MSLRSPVPLRAVGLVAGLVIATAALGGCGSTAGADSPQAAVTDFFHALGDKDAQRACAVVSTQGKPLEGVGLDQCVVGFEKVLDDLDDQADIAALKQARVTGAQVDGDKATVTKDQVTDVPTGFENDIDLVRLGGRWYIDSKTDTDDPSDPTTSPTTSPTSPLP